MTDTLRKLAEAATPGEWRASMQETKGGQPLGWIIEHANGRIGWSSYATARPNEGEGPPYSIGGANAAYIAAMHPGECLRLLDRKSPAPPYEAHNDRRNSY